METYENRIVLFLDILGFRKTIENTDNNSDGENQNLTKLILALKEMKKTITGSPKSKSKIITQFSDSIVISFKENDLDEFPSLFRNLQRTITSLMKKEILCRGAISYGKLYHDNDLVLGPALVDAYMAESEAAIYPRVIIDRSLMNFMKSKYSLNDTHLYREITFESLSQSYFRTDSDDKQYIDYFSGGGAWYRDNEMIVYFETLKKLILNGLKSKSPGISSKYGWMKNKFNKIPEDFIKIDEDEDLFYTRPDIKLFVDNFKLID